MGPLSQLVTAAATPPAAQIVIHPCGAMRRSRTLAHSLQPYWGLVVKSSAGMRSGGGTPAPVNSPPITSVRAYASEQFKAPSTLAIGVQTALSSKDPM